MVRKYKIENKNLACLTNVSMLGFQPAAIMIAIQIRFYQKLSNSRVSSHKYACIIAVIIIPADNHIV